MIALVEAYKAGLLKPIYWTSNLISGVVVGLIALPLAMAFAIAIGLKPEQGIYTAIIAGIIVGLFGGTRVQIAGPTGAFIVVLSSIVSQYGVSGLQMATILAGFILLLMGFTKVGYLIKFIPKSVIVGFTSGIGCIIFINQWKDFFGLTIEPSLHHLYFHEKIFKLLQAFPNLHLPTVALSCLGLAILLIVPKYIKRIPAVLIAMIIVTLVQIIFQFDGVATIGSVFGDISRELPNLGFPEMSLNKVLQLIGPAFSIALLGAIESLLAAVVADNITGDSHNSNQELIGQGLANLICPLFGGFASTGAIVRTMTNIRNGGNSPISAVIHSLTLVLIVCIFAPLTKYIPLCVLASILFVVAYNMSDMRNFINTIKNSAYYDTFILLSTFGLTIFVDLIVAVSVGVVLSVLFANKKLFFTDPKNQAY